MFYEANNLANKSLLSLTFQIGTGKLAGPPDTITTLLVLNTNTTNLPDDWDWEAC